MTYARILDLQDWPPVGEEVMFHSLTGWVVAWVLDIDRLGSVTLDLGAGAPALRRLHGPDIGQWLLYGEAP